MKEQFQVKNFQAKTLRLINHANAIIADMDAQGYTLTLRQLYYRLVESKILTNKQQNYDKLGYVVDEARKAGLIDWNAIEDRTRFLRSIRNYSDPSHFLTRMIQHYAEDLWRDQDNYCEVWIEKDALIGVVERPCNEYRVPHFACRGYPSSSELYIAGKRLKQKLQKHDRVIIFYLGDHDPSGLDMDRSNDDLLNMFGRTTGIEVKRLGLTFDQVQQYNLVPDPAKQTDSRFAAYAELYGDESYELDALRPQIIDQLIRDAILSVLDQEDFDNKLLQEEENNKHIQTIAENFGDVKRYFKYRKEDVEIMGVTEMNADDVLDIAERQNGEDIEE